MKDEMGETHSTHGRWQNHRFVIGKPERNRPLKRPMTFCTNTKTDLKEIRWHDVVHCTHVSEERGQKWVPSNNIINPFQYVHMQKKFNSHHNLLHILNNYRYLQIPRYNTKSNEMLLLMYIRKHLHQVALSNV
jgi:hypothetical protein